MNIRNANENLKHRSEQETDFAYDNANATDIANHIRSEKICKHIHTYIIVIVVKSN